MNKIRKGDEVVVTTGRDKGKRGSVVRLVIPDHLVVEGVNLIKKHRKPNMMKGEQGGIIEREAAVHISNVAIFNPQTKKADRVGFKRLEDKRMVRVFKSNGESIDA